MKKLIVKAPYEIKNESFDDFLEFLLLNENNIAKKLGHFAFLTGIFKDLFDIEAEETEEDDGVTNRNDSRRHNRTDCN